MERYRRLHPQGQSLIRGWYDRGREQAVRSDSAVFEAFIFTWIALNGWAACVTGEDRDASWRDGVAFSRKLGALFLEMRDDAGFEGALERFAGLWPLFDARDLRNRPGRASGHEREQLVRAYIREGATRFEPLCWVIHRQKGEACPLDLPHTMRALYRVRCNLFHGEKASHSEMDSEIVASALGVLQRVLARFLDL